MAGWLRTKLGALDFDNILAYDTFKVVHVRDRRLGGLYWFFNITVFAYVIFNIIADQKYNIKEAPVPGSIRISLQEPEQGIKTPDYCRLTNGCTYLAANQIIFPQGNDREVFITTRISRTIYTLPPNCDSGLPSSPECMYTRGTKNATRISYVADVENYTLMIEHSIRGKVTAVSKRSGLLKGTLYEKSDTVGGKAKAVKRFHNETAPPDVDGDILTLGELMRAARLTLDTPSYAPGANRAAGETQRSAGAVIVVVIDYQNQVSSPSEIKYGYWPSIIDGAEYKILEVIRNPDNTVTEINRHGVKIVFQQTGSIGHFDLITLMINLVSAIALLKVASIIVEVLMLRFLPEREIYHSCKFEHTEDFGDLRRLRKSGNGYEEQKEGTTADNDKQGSQSEPDIARPPSAAGSEHGLISRRHLIDQQQGQQGQQQQQHTSIEMNQR
ncbi:hypothetical protein SYNPS1DRAFT_29560 [Syncephalis pseudoplumigaleata]|uniref:Uncharacterized protein n=1 Tax=Syncephalis pseudoplumigaleata TaxID=1712513 RepID=A0A4P9YZ58_9FUNG|nr:hypothetical protein SYNPS1DRAFT_29560 [Syncephalis pseudoplumigaleata]|eukprot:RKP24681.1 hypothetical protein SYNPS1DRAFT_29560 [Syncephalis pseudoplumigaleata]